MVTENETFSPTYLSWLCGCSPKAKSMPTTIVTGTDVALPAEFST